MDWNESRSGDFGTTVSTHGAAVVVSVVGTIDMLTAPLLVESIEFALANGPTYLVIDLSAVEFLASAGLTVLLQTHHRSATTTRVAVVADGRATSRPMTLLGLDRTLTIYSTLADALAACAEPGGEIGS